jgi:hypothetical protein
VDLPVDVAKLVTRLIHPVFGELDREPASGRPVQPGEEPFDYPGRDHFQASQAGDLEWIEQVESRATGERCGVGHAGRNVFGWVKAGQGEGPRPTRRTAGLHR